MNTLKSLLTLAQSQTGYPEKNNASILDSFTIYGTGNYTKYARDLNAIGLPGCQGQPWCGVYQMWLEYKNSDKTTALKNLGPTFYNCFSTMNWAKNNNRWLAKTGTPKPGYRVIFSQSHIALVTNSKADLTITASVLNIRDYPKTGTPSGTYKKGDTVYPTAKTFINGGTCVTLYHLFYN